VLLIDTGDKLSREDRYRWLRDYLRTYLQWDLRDLAELGINAISSRKFGGK